MRKTNKFFTLFLLLSVAISGCSLLPGGAARRRSKSTEEEVADTYDPKIREIYDLYLANGGTLTYEEWLESVKGEKGDKGDRGDEGAAGPQGPQGIQGATGPQGPQGEQGQPGKDGSDGQTPYIGQNGNWWIGNTDTGVLAEGRNGEAGVSIVSTVINSEGELVITFSDGTETNVGKLTFTEHVHEYTSQIVNSTCSEDGYVTFTCKTCGHVETVINKATGHIFEAWRETVPATCYSDGIKVRYCSICGERQQETIPMHDHAISSSYIHNSVTHWHYCTECGVVLDEVNHNFAEGVCSVCGCIEVIPSAESGMVYSLNSDGESYTLVDYGSCTDLDILIPETYNDKPVTGIGNGAFSGINIKSVVMPNTIVSMGENCFRACSELETITLSNALETIPSYSFYGCSKLANITIPNGIKYIGDNVFQYCSSLTSLVFPDSVITLGGQCALECRNLERVVLSSNLQEVGYGAFVFCYNLSSITIPEGVRYLGHECFRYTAIQSAYIPSTVEYIGNWAFHECKVLESVIFADPTNWRIGNDPIAPELLQNGSVAARKLVNGEGEWYHN